MSSEASRSTLSQALKSISAIKIEELDKKRASYAAKKSVAVSVNLSHDNDNKHKTLDLWEEVNKLKLPVVDEKLSANTKRFIEHMKYDPTVPQSVLEDANHEMMDKLELQNTRLNYAKLYSTVLTQHLHGNSVPVNARSESDAMSEDFEMLEKHTLQELRERFEKVVFEEADTDEAKITAYLEQLLAGCINLDDLRERNRAEAAALWDYRDNFDHRALRWIIKGLLGTCLIKEEKKQLLRTFEGDDAVLDELCDVLNMRWANLANWTWTEDGKGVEVEPRRQLNGKYRVVMDDDLLQAMLLHYIGTKFSVNFRSRMSRWLTTIMKVTTSLEKGAEARWRFYNSFLNPCIRNTTTPGIERYADRGSLNKELQDTLQDDFFLTHLPRTVWDFCAYEDDEVDQKDEKQSKSWQDTKQQLLRHIASDSAIRYQLDGDVSVIKTDIQWFATSVSHKTIFAILRFIGIPDEWVDFFKKYLEVPLNMSKSTGENVATRNRKRGIPINHALERYFGEMILIFLDVAVKQKSGLVLYRMHDDIFLSGPTAQCEKAWETMQEFMSIVGLEFNWKKTGSVTLTRSPETCTRTSLPAGDVIVGFLKLSAEHKTWVIDETEVSAHIKQLGKQLDECDDLLSYIRTYNSCIHRFFGSTFGEPAKCFGPQHIHDILTTHNRVQVELFGHGGVASKLKPMLDCVAAEEGLRIQVTDSFLFTPLSLGGLGVVNPFVPLRLLGPDIKISPTQRINEFLQKERDDYDKAKSQFEECTVSMRRKVRARILEDDNELDKDDHEFLPLDKFLSYEEYTSHRYSSSRSFLDLYNELISQPSPTPIHLAEHVRADLNFWLGDIKKLSDAEQYIVQLFSDEMFKTFGTVSILDRSLVPLGIMKAIMRERVAWQMVVL